MQHIFIEHQPCTGHMGYISENDRRIPALEELVLQQAGVARQTTNNKQ